LHQTRYLLNERWGVEGAAEYERLLNDAADSPITEQGSADQYTVRVGITRRISLDF
jgi:outer membrane protein